MLTFNPDRHEYRHGGHVVPHVTGILAPLYDLSHIQADALERARQEGVAVHRMVELDVLGDLDEDGLPEWLRPRLAAWRKFLAETRFVPACSEEPVYHRMFGYAGTLDLAGYFDDRPAIIDIKRSFSAGAVIGLQLAAYANAKGKPWDRAERHALRLDGDGTYRLTRFTDDDDFGAFCALLKIQRWKEKHQ